MASHIFRYSIPNTILTAEPVTPCDPNFDNNLALLHFDEGDGSSSIVDVTGRSWTNNGLLLSSTQTKFNASSLRLIGVNGQSLTTPSFINFNANFTIEFWVYVQAVPVTGGYIFSIDGLSSVHASNSIHVTQNGNIYFLVRYAVHPANTAYSIVGNISFNEWHHIACTRFGNELNMFIDGVKQTPVTITTEPLAQNGQLTYIGRYYHTNNPETWTGYLDEIRVSNFARYTENFDVPTEPFADVSCISNQVIMARTDTSHLNSQYTTDIQGSEWTNVPFVETAITNQAFFANSIVIGNYIYLQQWSGQHISYANKNNLGLWTTISGPSVSAGGGEVATDGAYLYRAGGVQPLNRMLLPTGTLESPTTSTDSRANGIVVLNGTIIVSYTHSGYAVRASSNQGASWEVRGAVHNMSFSNPRLATDGTNIIFSATKGFSENYEIMIKRSTDGGYTWSTDLCPNPTNNSGTTVQRIVYTGKNFIILISDGRTFYSNESGTVWKQGATLSPVVVWAGLSVGLNGEAIAYSNTSTNLYITRDFGQSWQAFPSVGVGSGVRSITFI